MRIGIFGGVVNTGTIDDMVETVRQADAAGFASYWEPNIFGHDALTALAVAAREVPRIALGTAVVPTYPRHPAALAQQAGTVNAISGGRLTLGIGLSHQIVIEGMFGMDYSKPLRHMREYLSVLLPLSRGEKADFDGEELHGHVALNAAGSLPYGVVLAALGPKMLQLAGAVADGTLTWCTGPETLRTYVLPTINAAAEAAGRAVPRVIAGLGVAVTDDIDATRERAAKVFAVYGTLPSYRSMLDREGATTAADVMIIGSAQQVADTLGELSEMGVTDFAAVEVAANADDRAATRDVLTSFL
jgi:5,10-methylenetetrahydromethanopterin reductase